MDMMDCARLLLPGSREKGKSGEGRAAYERAEQLWLGRLKKLRV